MRASWERFDRVVADGARRRCARARAAAVATATRSSSTCVGAESAYARKIGVRRPAPIPATGARWRSCARRWSAAITHPDPEAAGPKGWPPRYAARRIAWHVLDHAWEIEDRADFG